MVDFMLGTYSENKNDGMRGKVQTVESAIGFQLDCVRSADWHNGWSDVEGTFTVDLIRNNLAPRQVQHMSVMFPWAMGKSGSRDGWRRLASKAHNGNMVRSFTNKLRALPRNQSLLYLSTSYETIANFWFNDIMACGGEAAYTEAVKQARACADEAEKAVPGKKIVLCHNPVNEQGRSGAYADFRRTFVPGAHGAILINCYDKPQYQGGNAQAVLKYWLDAYCGLNSIVAIAKQHNVPWGIAEMGFQSNGADIGVLTRGVLSFCQSNWDAGGGMCFFLPWPSDDAYPGNVFAGRSPKAAADLVGLMRGLKELQQRKPLPPKPVEPPKPEIPQPLEDCFTMNSGAFVAGPLMDVAADREVMARVAHLTWVPLAHAGTHGKTGPVPAGAETDPQKVKQMVADLLAGHSFTDPDAKPHLETWAVFLPKPTAGGGPKPEPEPEPGAGEVERLKRRVAELEAQQAATLLAAQNLVKALTPAG